MSSLPYQQVYGKACHFLVELEHKALRSLKKLNFEWQDAAKLRINKINELDEFLLRANESSAHYKEKIKLYHDRKIKKKIFKNGDKVLLYNSRPHLFPGKLNSRWYGPFTVLRVLPYGALELKHNGEAPFKVNGQ